MPRTRDGRRIFWYYIGVKTHDVINGCIAAAAICAAWTPAAAAHDTAARIVRVDAPAKVWTNSAGRVVADFGRDMFGAPEVVSGADGAEIWVGERLSGDAIDRTPPGSVRAAKLPLAADKRNTGPDAVPLPEEFGVVIPFRYAEYPASAGVELRRRTVVVPMDMSASSFRCSDEKLNRVWDFCKETILATSFAGVYVDGDRERIPYEADAYVNMLGEQAVWADGAMAKATIAWLAEKPTWPTEWSQLYVSLVHGYYMATGDRETFDRHLPLCRRRMRVGRIREDGLLVRKSGNIVDWPAGERDGYDMDVEVNAVVNAFYWRNLRELCATKEDESEAERVRASFVRAFLDDASGLVRDGEGSEHHSLHANALALSLGLIPQAHRAKAWAFCKSRGMACSPYFAQFLLEAAFEMDDPAYALSLMTSEDERSWLGMMRAGATMTMEAWNQKAKPNQDWNHAWSTAPLNIAMRKILGVEPLEPGYASVRVRPRLGPLSFAEGRVPTVRGEVSVECRSASLAVTIPRGVRAEVVLPWSGESRSVGEGRHVFSIGDDPASVSTRVARQFLSADPLDYRPEGFRGSGYFAEHGYGDGTAPHYAVVSLWANAIACARKSCDWKTLDELVASFDRFYGEARLRPPSLGTDQIKRCTGATRLRGFLL